MVDSTDTLQFQAGEDGTDVMLGSYAELEKWLSSEQAKWEWLRGAKEQNLRNVYQNVSSAFQQLRQAAIQQQQSGKPLHTLRGQLETQFKGGPLRFSESVIGAVILDIRAAAGDVAATFAYAFLLQQVTLAHAATPDHVKGVLLLAFPGLVDPSEIAERLSAERANYRSSLRSALQRIDKIRDEQDEVARSLLRRAAGVGIRTLRRHRDVWRKAQASWQSEATQAVADIREVENAYNERMRLQAPVEYWRAKSAEHATAESTALQRLRWYFPGAALAIVVAFALASGVLLDASEQRELPTAIYLIVSAGLASLAGLAFWVGRLLTKLYLSEHHLRHDAKERAVMTTTYLALTREQAAEAGDRQIILGALFRPTSDGIVKDDGPPDMSIGALLGRTGVR